MRPLLLYAMTIYYSIQIAAKLSSSPFSFAANVYKYVYGIFYLFCGFIYIIHFFYFGKRKVWKGKKERGVWERYVIIYQLPWRLRGRFIMFSCFFLFSQRICVWKIGFFPKRYGMEQVHKIWRWMSEREMESEYRKKEKLLWFIRFVQSHLIRIFAIDNL